jgi:small subunit ribosomal protein S19
MKRSKKKGPFVILKNENKINTNISTILKRNFEITSKIIGSTCQVYDGKNFLKLNISENMVGHKLGEFAPTRGKFIFKKKNKKK